jgi:hypothetical protein
MARLILKSPYIKSTGGASGYLRYIATRERVELIPDDRPPTRKQEQLIAKLVKDFPDSKTLYEYEDYLIIHIEVHGFLDELIFALAVVGSVPLLDLSSGFRLHPECNTISGFFTHSIPPFCCKTSLKSPATRGFSGKLTPSVLILPLKDASFKRPKLPALRAEVAAAAALATPCLYPAFSFVLQKSAENGSHPGSILWQGLGLASSWEGTHKAFCRL